MNHLWLLCFIFTVFFQDGSKIVVRNGATLAYDGEWAVIYSHDGDRVFVGSNRNIKGVIQGDL